MKKFLFFLFLLILVIFFVLIFGIVDLFNFAVQNGKIIVFSNMKGHFLSLFLMRLPLVIIFFSFLSWMFLYRFGSKKHYMYIVSFLTVFFIGTVAFSFLSSTAFESPFDEILETAKTFEKKDISNYFFIKTFLDNPFYGKGNISFSEKFFSLLQKYSNHSFWLELFFLFSFFSFSSSFGSWAGLTSWTAINFLNSLFLFFTYLWSMFLLSDVVLGYVIGLREWGDLEIFILPVLFVLSSFLIFISGGITKLFFEEK